MCVVYDVSTHSERPFLNECLHTGPKLNQRIVHILLQFHVHRVAVTTNVKKAFLMVSIVKLDRDALDFLWVDEVLAEQPNIIVL